MSESIFDRGRALKIAREYVSMGVVGTAGLLARALVEACGPMDELKPLTKRQREILDFITDYIAKHDYAPTFAEIAAPFGYRSLATVHEHLQNLERKGYLSREFNDARAIAVKHPRITTPSTEKQ